MNSREEFEAWLANSEWQKAADEDAWKDLCFVCWQASRAAALEEAAKECDLMQVMWERQARGGDNTGASDFRADAAEQCAMGIRALKGE